MVWYKCQPQIKPQNYEKDGFGLKVRKIKYDGVLEEKQTTQPSISSGDHFWWIRLNLDAYETFELLEW